LPGSAIAPADLESGLDRLQPGSIALLNTGRGGRRANTADFLTQYVYLGGPAAELLVSRGVKGVGIDAVSMGGYDDPAKAGPAHRAILGDGGFITEELYFPDAVMDGRERLFVAMPIKLQGCSGAWARAMLWEA
jgi:kynurenine formamidase